MRAQRALALHRILSGAFAPGEYVGQESFLSAGEALCLARAAGLAPTTRGLDLCSGNGGVALLLARACGCRILGVDRAPPAVYLARHSARREQLAERVAFVVGDAVQAPVYGRFEAVLLFETMLAIDDKAALLSEVASLLTDGGGFALTLEAGEPLSQAERREMPEGEDIHLLPEAAFLAVGRAAGLRSRLRLNLTSQHAERAANTAEAARVASDRTRSKLGEEGWRNLVAASECWARWLACGRAHKLGFVLERADQHRPGLT